jgi:hypothetical protein
MQKKDGIVKEGPKFCCACKVQISKSPKDGMYRCKDLMCSMFGRVQADKEPFTDLKEHRVVLDMSERSAKPNLEKTERNIRFIYS